MRRLVVRLRSRSVAFVHDLLMLPVAWLGAFYLRFNLEPVPLVYLEQAYQLLPMVVLINGTVFWMQGLYRGVWRFASLPDLVRIVKAVAVGVAVTAIAIFLVTRMEALPRSVLPLQALLLVVLLGGPRLLYRWLKDRNLYRADARNVLIVGAGDAGERLVRELLRDRQHQFRPIGFVDDDPAKRGMEIHGIRVLAKCSKLPRVVRQRSVALVVLAMPSATGEQMRRMAGLCEAGGVAVRTMPDLRALMSGRAGPADLRRLSIDDLLGRAPVSLDWETIRAGAADRCIMVTGGAGSIGAELCRQLARLAPRRLLVVDRHEFGLYEIERELKSNFARLDFTVRLGDVCDRAGMSELFASEKPDVVFHAAAYKHVPMLENQVREAVRNNVLGTRNIAELAAAHKTPAMVLISSDKAVNPTNVMGATKRIAEIYCQNVNDKVPGTRYITVRFGNVLGSAGSVVPLFKQQIEAGGPVTVTDPAMQRYFMTIPEASQLILEAGAVGQGGEIYVLDMGEPVHISYLAEQMISLAGKTVGKDIMIEYAGLRPGEKLFEELFHEHENVRATVRDKLLLAEFRTVDWERFEARLDALLGACARSCVSGFDEASFDEAEILRLVVELVPEYVPQGHSVGREANNVVELKSARR
ncbi:MAG: NAD-dependent epimerase/dehydratase family protein [Gammaproteobacteria bacterium]|nr:NAD-dependent epimerase/dehydratase family protein [Gammaproteobacteria bacterium]